MEFSLIFLRLFRLFGEVRFQFPDSYTHNLYNVQTIILIVINVKGLNVHAINQNLYRNYIENNFFFS
jgi:hypothetical protein